MFDMNLIKQCIHTFTYEQDESRQLKRIFPVQLFVTKFNGMFSFLINVRNSKRCFLRNALSKMKGCYSVGCSVKTTRLCTLANVLQEAKHGFIR